jgi:hypothetical protein
VAAALTRGVDPTRGGTHPDAHRKHTRGRGRGHTHAHQMPRARKMGWRKQLAAATAASLVTAREEGVPVPAAARPPRAGAAGRQGGRKRKAEEVSAALAALPALPTTQLEAVRNYIRTGRNAHTSATYEAAWRGFVRWTEATAHTRKEGDEARIERPREEDVAAYLHYLVRCKGAAQGTVTAALAGIADHLRYITTAEYNPCGGELVRQMRAVLLPQAKAAVQKKEMEWSMLLRIMEACGRDGGAVATRDACMIALGFYGFLRTSEVARMKRGEN